MVAFWKEDNMWREVVIREMYKLEAYAICAKNERVRATLMEISNLKPVHALNKMEADGGGV